MNASRQYRGRRAAQRHAALGLVALLLWPGLSLLGGCGGSASGGSSRRPSLPQVDLWPSDDAPGGQSPVREGCDLLAGEGDPNGTFVFALNEEVRPGRAPVPHNRSERIVFAHLYETLVTVDCAGNLQPGLADHWTCTEDSMVWVFTLREEARFWDGSRLTAGEVRLSWARSQDALRARGSTSPWAWLNAREQTVQVIDARHLAVRLPEPQARFPMLLAHPATAVAARRDGWTWPVGSGSARLRASDPAPRPDLFCRPNPSHPDPPHWKSLVFRVEPGADPRDLVATDIDLAVVRDLRTVSFFSDAPGFQPQPLPWDLLYILVCPPQANPDGAARWVEAAAGLDMVRDVTRVSTREWTEIVFPGGGGADCPQLSGPIADSGSARLDWNLAARELDNNTLVYPEDDPGAREIAHRLSALSGGPVRTSALPAAAVDFTLQWQMAGAFIVPAPQYYPTGCLQLANLLGRAAWLQEAALGKREAHHSDSLAAADAQSDRPPAEPLDALRRQGAVHPLGLSRSWLVVHGSLTGLHLAFDGTPLLDRLGRAGGEAAP